MMPIPLIATAIGLGMAYAAAPGAVNTEALRRGVRWGARSALLVETGSLIGDSLWAVLAFTGVTLLTRYLALQIALGITGGFFLLRLAWLAYSLKCSPAGTLPQNPSPPHEGISLLEWCLAWPIP
jgi:threonine/homoserine/homoserine lactone efflux protein